MEEDVEDNELSINEVSNNDSVRRKYYTARDRVCFSKIAAIRASYQGFRTRMDEIGQSEARLQ